MLKILVGLKYSLEEKERYRMNLLIVDDNKNNRLILRLLLEDYMDENEGVSFSMDEAVDGLEAVRMCDEKEYDLVFMDIMMPNMDGIESTKLIRQNHKKLLIIAVSAVDDAERQKQILSNGAEDYISKPVNSDIFYTRIANYVSLVNSRETHTGAAKTNEDGVNLFTENIFSRYTNFILNSEDSLSELWEYYLLDGEEKCDGLSDVIRTVFSIAEVQLKLEVKSNLIVEDSEECRYFTLTEIDKIPSKIIPLLLKKNEICCEYKQEDGKLSFKLSRLIKEFEEVIPTVQTTPIAPALTVPVVESISLTSGELYVYDYIESEDMADLEEYTNRLNSLMLIVGSGDVSEDEIAEIYTYLEKLGAILSTYSEVYAISKALSLLASDMSTHIAEFMKNSEAMGPMCAAFSKDLSNWIEQSFHSGAPSVDFMNDTIVVNCETIGGMLKMDDAPAGGDEDFDDMFF